MNSSFGTLETEILIPKFGLKKHYLFFKTKKEFFSLLNSKNVDHIKIIFKFV